MLTAFLSGSGGRVLIPDAVDTAPGDSEDEVRFVDAEGRTLVVFKRADVSLYTGECDNMPALDEEASA
jgi:hypothetical protein